MQEEIDRLKLKAKKLRKDVLDLAVIHKDGHIAPAFSIVEILTLIYDRFLGEEDKIILSKGHGCLSFYCALMDKGYNPKISGHPDMEKDQGICCTTGSLGHGLPIGIGMAFAKKLMNRPGHVYVILGDGECQEGTTWESMNLAKRFKLNNITIIVDNNNLQALGSIGMIMGETNLAAKFEVFGGEVACVDGHDFKQLIDALSKSKINESRPHVIVAHTVKGKGISFMENTPKWHARLPEGDELSNAYEELK